MPPVRDPRKSPIKGAKFKSFLEPPSFRLKKFTVHPDRALPKGQTWLAHSGRKARLRNLRNQCAQILKDKDLEVVAAVQRIREALKDDPEPEYGFLNILNAARMASEDVEVTIVDSIDYMLKKWAEQDDAEPQREEAAGV